MRTRTTKEIGTYELRDTSDQVVIVKLRGSTAGVLYRYINTLDADIHITIDGTDDIDGETFDYPEALPVGGETSDPNETTKLVSAGDTTTQIDSTLISEGWPWVRITITPQTTPTTGSIELRDVKNF